MTTRDPGQAPPGDAVGSKARPGVPPERQRDVVVQPVEHVQRQQAGTGEQEEASREHGNDGERGAATTKNARAFPDRSSRPSPAGAAIEYGRSGCSRSGGPSGTAHAELQAQPPTLEPQPQHRRVPPQTRRPLLEATGGDRQLLGRLAMLAFRDRVPPGVERVAVPLPPGLMIGGRLAVTGNRPASGLEPGDQPVQAALAVSVTDGHRSHAGDFVPRTPLHAHSRGPLRPAPFAWLARDARSRSSQVAR